MNLEKALWKDRYIQFVFYVGFLICCCMTVMPSWGSTLVWIFIFSAIAYEDMKSTSVPMGHLFVFFMYTLLSHLGDYFMGDGILTLILGSLILPFVWILKKHVGQGDGWVLLVIILEVGIAEMIHILFVAAVMGISYKLLSKWLKDYDKSADDEIAFIPFLLGSTLFWLMQC